VSSSIECPAGVRTVLVRNVAARGLWREFDVVVEGEGDPVGGTLEVRRSFLPLFLLASTAFHPVVARMRAERGYLDASFELAITPTHPVRVTIT
jgi:hypothetical protein